MTQEELAQLYGIKVDKPEKKDSYGSYGKGGGKNYNSKKFDNKPKKNSPKTNPPKNNSPKSNSPKNVDSNDTATAPYNFVSLPDKPLTSEIDGVENFKEHILKCEKLSGEIVLDIETLTPLFIGGNPEKSTVTFAPLGQPIIAGSSLRGMFKNIFKIVTCGTFRGRTDSQKKGEDFNDEHIYYRCIMGTPYDWMKTLNKVYKTRMEGDKGKNARPGFLIQMTNGKFFIAPSKYAHDNKKDFIMIKDFQQKYPHRPVKFKDSGVYWDFEEKKAYILTGNQWARTPENLLTLDEYEKFKESLKGLTEEDRTKKIEDTNYGKQIIRFVKIDDVNWSRESWIKLPDDVRESYEHDRNRRGVNLFKDKGILERDKVEQLTGKSLPDIETLVPCHFLYEGDQVTAFGHGQCFRIPYKNSIGSLVPDALKDTTLIDFSDAIFGHEKDWAGRVYFEDAVITKNLGTLDKDAAHPLIQPNPTSYQLYLQQNGAHGENLNHWDEVTTTLRGYKLYWHNKNWDWQATPDERALDRDKTPAKRMTKDMSPLKKGATFKSKIRFQNLSAVELGALLMIFDLDGKGASAAYKIGHGKPFGFGSIKITPNLFIESDDAYENIFDNDGWKNPYVSTSPKKYLDAFKKHVADHDMISTWQKVMNELNAILDWDNKPSPEKIKALGNEPDRNGRMQLSEKFKARAPLPTIFEVLK